MLTLPPNRDALSDLALHFLNKMKIMVVKDIEREDIEFICKVRSSLWLQQSTIQVLVSECSSSS